MRDRLDDAGFDTGPSETPIIPAVVGEDMAAFIMCKRLVEEGVFVNPVVSPAVEQGNALIRLSLMATHTEDEIHQAMDMMAKVGKEMGIIPGLTRGHGSAPDSSTRDVPGPPGFFQGSMRWP